MPFLLDYRTHDSEMSLSYKVYWALNTTGIVMAMGITVAYWFTVYDPGKCTLRNLAAYINNVGTSSNYEKFKKPQT
jgi:hypothetical protein